MTLRGLRCDCGSDEIAALAPGSEPVTTDLFMLLRGEATRAWCLACWLLAHRVRAA